MFDGLSGKFSVILTNPPYIKSEDIERLQTEVKNYEPRVALDGGEDGLDFYRRIADGAKGRLFDGGVILAEIGEAQGQAVRDIFVNGGYAVEVYKDISGNDRIVKAVKL